MKRSDADTGLVAQDILVIHEHTQQKSRTVILQEDESCPTALTLLSAKIRDFCIFARLNGYRFVWVDTCCIDKTSSAELSEAINSMYSWYSQASVCYAFLQDVGDDENPRARTAGFRHSKWFRRGWTLQELIAPAEVLFVSREWRVVGSKETLADVVEEITGIDSNVLNHRRTLDSVSVARRMSWAARRETTRVEDEAYSLMGIFGVNMPTIYGEGRNAFVRLQKEILEHSPDQSIFAWGYVFPDYTVISEGFHWYQVDSEDEAFARTDMSKVEVPSDNACLFAMSPAAFADSADITPVPLETFAARLSLRLTPPHYVVTSHGVHVHFPIVTNCHTGRFTLAVLACQDASENLVALMLRPISGVNLYVAGSRFHFDRDDSPLPRDDNVGEVPLDAGDDLYLLYEGVYCRCTTILPEAMSHTYPSQKLTFILDDFYIPSHRSLTSRTRGRAEAELGTNTTVSLAFSYAGPCEITFPSWLPAQLKAFGLDLSLSEAQPADVRMPTAPIALDWSNSWYRVLTLSSGPESQGGETIDIHLLLCPHDASELQSVHATVIFRDEPNALHRSAFHVAPTCEFEHVDSWSNASKLFVQEGRERSVRLTFSRMSLVGRRKNVYSLLVDVGSLPLDDPKRFTVQRRPVLRAREWSWSGEQFWDGEGEESKLSISSSNIGLNEGEVEVVEEL